MYVCTHIHPYKSYSTDASPMSVPSPDRLVERVLDQGEPSVRLSPASPKPTSIDHYIKQSTPDYTYGYSTQCHSMKHNLTVGTIPDCGTPGGDHLAQRRSVDVQQKLVRLRRRPQTLQQWVALGRDAVRVQRAQLLEGPSNRFPNTARDQFGGHFLAHPPFFPSSRSDTPFIFTNVAIRAVCDILPPKKRSRVFKLFSWFFLGPQLPIRYSPGYEKNPEQKDLLRVYAVRVCVDVDPAFFSFFYFG